MVFQPFSWLPSNMPRSSERSHILSSGFGFVNPFFHYFSFFFIFPITCVNIGITPQNVAAPTTHTAIGSRCVRKLTPKASRQKTPSALLSPSGAEADLCRAGGRAHEQRQQRHQPEQLRRGQQQLKALHDGQDRQAFRERIERLRQLGRPRRGQTRAAQQRRHARQHRGGQRAPARPRRLPVPVQKQQARGRQAQAEAQPRIRGAPPRPTPRR